MSCLPKFAKQICHHKDCTQLATHYATLEVYCFQHATHRSTNIIQLSKTNEVVEKEEVVVKAHYSNVKKHAKENLQQEVYPQVVFTNEYKPEDGFHMVWLDVSTYWIQRFSHEPTIQTVLWLDALSPYHFGTYKGAVNIVAYYLAHCVYGCDLDEQNQLTPAFYERRDQILSGETQVTQEYLLPGEPVAYHVRINEKDGSFQLYSPLHGRREFCQLYCNSVRGFPKSQKQLEQLERIYEKGHNLQFIGDHLRQTETNIRLQYLDIKTFFAVEFILYIMLRYPSSKWIWNETHFHT